MKSKQFCTNALTGLKLIIKVESPLQLLYFYLNFQSKIARQSIATINEDKDGNSALAITLPYSNCLRLPESTMDVSGNIFLFLLQRIKTSQLRSAEKNIS